MPGRPSVVAGQTCGAAFPQPGAREGAQKMSDEEGSLQDYMRTKHALADVLEQAQAFLGEELDDRWGAEQCRRLLAKLAEDRFNLVVVGQFSRGKSTLMNALFGRSILPTGMLPLTSIITSVRYGPRERLVLVREKSSFPQEVNLDTMPRWVTQEGNPGNRERISEAIVELPAPFLRRGFFFVDTPGVGSAEAANTATTFGFLPQVDAAILVTSVDSPLTEIEISLLRETVRFAAACFLVINKKDLIDASDESERASVVDYVKQQAARAVGTAPRVYLVSSLKALQESSSAPDDGDDDGGIRELREDLERFLTVAKRETFLRSMMTKTLHALSAMEERARLVARVSNMSEAEAASAQKAMQVTLDAEEDQIRAALLGIRGALDSAARPLIEDQMTAAIPAWREFMGHIVSELEEREAGLPWESRLSSLSFRDRVLASMAAEQGAWLRETLRSAYPRMQEASAVGLKQIGRTISGIGARAAEALDIMAAHASGDVEGPAIPSLIEVPVTPVELREKPSALGGLLPHRLRLSMVRRWLVKRIDRCVEASREHVRAAFEGTLATMADVLEGEALRQFADRREALERTIRSQEKPRREPLPSAADVLRARVLSLMGEEAPTPVSVRGADEPLPRGTSFDSILTTPATRTMPRSKAPARGCRICVAQEEVLFDMYATWQYRLSVEADFRNAFAARGGFCPLHTWRFEQIASPTTISVGFAPLVERIAAALRSAADMPAADVTRTLGAALADESGCLACSQMREVESVEVGRLLEAVSSEGQENASRTAFGLCLPHLRSVLAKCGEQPATDVLVRQQISKLESLSDNMRGFSLKREAGRRGLVNSGEDDAWVEALRRIAGLRNTRISVRLDSE